MEKIILIESQVPIHENPYRTKRKEVQDELNSEVIDTFSFESFQKSKEEKSAVKEIKALWKGNMLKKNPLFKKKQHKYVSMAILN